MKNKIKIGGIIAVIFFACFLNACNIKNDKESTDSESEEESTSEVEYEDCYSRAVTEETITENFYGRRPDDAAYVALEYIYSSTEFEEEYGDDFDVGDDSGGYCESLSEHAISIFFDGYGRYIFYVENDVWVFELSKEKYGKWEISDYYLDSEEE